jgi:methionyl-tRNA formyltransferase
VSKADAELDFGSSLKQEYDRFRAFTPFPGAWVATSHGPLKLRRVSGGRSPVETAPGTVVSVKPFEVAFADGSLVFEEVQPQARKSMPGADYANGARIVPGDCLKLEQGL